MRSRSFNAFPHCAKSQFYTTACDSDTGMRYSLVSQCIAMVTGL